MSAERIAELEEEVRQLRSLLHLQPEMEMVATLQWNLRLTRHQALLLTALYDAGSSWMATERLDMVLPERRNDPRCLKTIGVRVSQLRKILGHDAIICRSNAGYTLGASGVEACKRALGIQVQDSAA